MAVTLKQLEAFYWAATCLNFSVAAERVHLSVSSLSKRISELEAGLGTTLFDRSGRSARLTAQGLRLLPQVRQVLEATVQLEQLAGSEMGLQGRCRIGVGELSALTWLPRLVRCAAERYPALALEPRSDIGQALEQRIETGELDCLVIAGPSSRSALASELVASVEFVWVASEDLIARAGTDDPRELAGKQLLIVLPDGSGAVRVLDQWLAQHHIGIQQRLSCNSWGAIVAMVIEGVGFGYMPRQWAEALSGQGGLRILQRGGAIPLLPYTIQWRRDDNRPLVQAMRAIIKEVIDFPAPRCFVARQL